MCVQSAALSQRYITLSQILLPHHRVGRLALQADTAALAAVLSPSQRAAVCAGKEGCRRGRACSCGRNASPLSSPLVLSAMVFAISQMTLQPPWLSCSFCPCCSFTDLSPSP
ncbi:unnamed protein product [Rangifer tarandus platyrhynchus]|uniref:Uncharacterized protein n=1 Tax=Rangifer tarandus platyrhynchus TaxID=3082113 RepID=A0AC59Y8D2_RANTA